jgi:hypothetical protein
MSFWVTQKYFSKIDSRDPYIEIYGGCKGYDTPEEAINDIIKYNASLKRRYDNMYCHGPYLTPSPRFRS